MEGRLKFKTTNLNSMKACQWMSPKFIHVHCQVMDALDAVVRQWPKLQTGMFTIPLSSKNGDDISSVPTDHKQSRDALNKEIHVLHVAVSGVMRGRRGQAHQNNSCRYWIPHDYRIQFQARVQEFVDLFKSITIISHNILIVKGIQTATDTCCAS
jgi:hypothetical protein